MSCSSRIRKSANVDPLFSERTSLRLTQEKAAAAMIGSVRAQTMNDSTLHKFVLRRNNQMNPVIYNDVIQRRSSPGACFTEGNIFTITDRVSQYILKDGNNIIRTGSYYISSDLLNENGIISESDTPILFFFRGESKKEEVIHFTAVGSFIRGFSILLGGILAGLIVESNYINNITIKLNSTMDLNLIPIHLSMIISVLLRFLSILNAGTDFPKSIFSNS